MILLKKRFSVWATLAILSVLGSACNGSTGASSPLTTANQQVPADARVEPVPTVTPAPTPTADPAPGREYATAALLFAGTGTWSAEVASIESILQSHGASYQKVTSAQLNAMTLDQLASFGALIFPGGKGGTQAASLTSQTHARIRAAVQERGVGYVGFCAGAFIAQAPAPAPGGDVSYGLGVVDGPVMDYYYLENQGTTVAMTMLDLYDGSTADVLWYGGPMTPDEGVIARYPDGTPAMSELWSGKGLVVVSGPHPTATQSILNSLGVRSSDGLHLDLTWKLIDAAIRLDPLTE